MIALSEVPLRLMRVDVGVVFEEVKEILERMGIWEKYRNDMMTIIQLCNNKTR